MVTLLEEMRKREQAAREYIPTRSMVTGEHGWIMSLRKPQWAIDQALLLDVAEAAAEYSKWRIEIQRWDVDTDEWPVIATNLRVAEIALMSAIGKLKREVVK